MTTCRCCGGDTKRRGFYRNKNFNVQRFECLKCGTTFSEKQPLDNIRVDFNKALQVIHLLVEGTGIRACERLTGLNRRTVLGILKTAGEKCARLLDEKIRNVEIESAQVDELYSYVFCLEKNNEFKSPEIGEQYTFLAVDRTSKLILSSHTGKRDLPNTEIFMRDLRKRVKNACQLTTDAFAPYPSAVSSAFGLNVHYAQETKVFAESFPIPKRMRKLHRPEGCIGVKRRIRIGNPNPTLISTSHVERTNLSVRLFNRRFTRLTMGYSKKLENLRLAIALFVAHFDFCRVHSAHGQTPAQKAGITNHTWTLNELISAPI